MSYFATERETNDCDPAGVDFRMTAQETQGHEGIGDGRCQWSGSRIDYRPLAHPARGKTIISQGRESRFAKFESVPALVYLLIATDRVRDDNCGVSFAGQGRKAQ